LIFFSIPRTQLLLGHPMINKHAQSQSLGERESHQWATHFAKVHTTAWSWTPGRLPWERGDGASASARAAAKTAQQGQTLRPRSREACVRPSVRGAIARSAGARASARTSADGAIARSAGARASARTSARGAHARSAGARASARTSASGLSSSPTSLLTISPSVFTIHTGRG